MMEVLAGAVTYVHAAKRVQSRKQWRREVIHQILTASLHAVVVVGRTKCLRRDLGSVGGVMGNV
jgi:hypothetical protein